MLKTLGPYLKKPELYQKGDACFWTDPYISKQVLKAHLDPNDDAASRTSAFIKSSVEWISNLLPSQTYPQLLDLGCGPGLYAEAFYQKGYHVTGIDFSNHAIAYAKSSADRKRLKIDYRNENYLLAQFSRNYHIITLIYCDFGVISKDERAILLKKAYHLLTNGGCLLLDVFTLEKYKGLQEYKHWTLERQGFWQDDLYLLLEAFYRYDEDQTFLKQYNILTDHKVTCYRIWEHTFTHQELESDLFEAGFKEIKWYGNIAGEDYHKSSDTICIQAIK